jgi:hypothetical protein
MYGNLKSNNYHARHANPNEAVDAGGIQRKILWEKVKKMKNENMEQYVEYDQATSMLSSLVAVKRKHTNREDYNVATWIYSGVRR